jgi:hypothetical protein
MGPFRHDAVPWGGWLDALRAPYVDKQVYGVGGFAKPRWLGPPMVCRRISLGRGMQSSRNTSSNPYPVRTLWVLCSFRKIAFDEAAGLRNKLAVSALFGCED